MMMVMMMVVMVMMVMMMVMMVMVMMIVVILLSPKSFIQGLTSCKVQSQGPASPRSSNFKF